MDAKQFLAEFGHIANAPGGVGKLRELILSLAVTGRLVAQNSEEQPASEWLQACDQMKAKLAAEKKIPKPKRLADIAPEEMPFAPPPGWSFARLGRFTSKIGSGSTPRGGSKTYVKKGIPFLRSQNVWNDGIRLDDVAYITPDTNLNMGGTILQAHDLLLNITGASLGRCAVVPTNLVPANVSQHVTIIRLLDATVRHYLHICFLSPLLQSMIWGRQVGMAREGLSKKVLEQFEIPLPPIKEQSRIVAKVNELMALCDKLEAQQQIRRKLQNNLRQSTLQAVANATSPNELQTTWTRLTNNFGWLFHTPEDVADLRKLASELAIRGVLDVGHEQTNSSTVDIYLAELGRKKSGKRFAKSVQPDEEFSLPNGWRWVLLEDLLSDSESGWSPKCEAQPRREGEWGVLKVSAVTWGAFDPNENKRLPLSLEARPECAVRPGDFMLSRANTAELVARGVIAPDDCPEKLLMSDKIVRLNFLDNALKPWVNLVNNSDFARVYYKERATGTSDSMRNVSRQVIHELPIPLPSLKAQERILLVLSRLLRYCDSLEKQAASRMELSAQLAASAIASLTGIAIEQEEEPMKAPQTELIAPLRLGTAPDIKAQAPLATILARHNGEMSAKDLWQRFGGEIDAFYAQLKTEVAHGWILEPTPAEMREKPANVEIA